MERRQSLPDFQTYNRPVYVGGLSMKHTSQFETGRFGSGRFSSKEDIAQGPSFTISISGVTANPEFGPTAQIGQTLTASAAGFSDTAPDSIDWHWQDENGPIPGADGPDYVPTKDDDLKKLRAIAVPSNGYALKSSQTLAVRNVPPVKISSISNRNLTLNGKIKTINGNVGRKFQGEDLAYSVSGYAGSFMNGARLRIDPYLETTGMPVVVAATNSGGTASVQFTVVVEPLKFASSGLTGSGLIGDVHTAAALVTRSGASLSYDFQRDGV